jgi:hypothetical protein
MLAKHIDSAVASHAGVRKKIESILSDPSEGIASVVR